MSKRSQSLEPKSNSYGFIMYHIVSTFSPYCCLSYCASGCTRFSNPHGCVWRCGDPAGQRDRSLRHIRFFWPDGDWLLLVCVSDLLSLLHIFISISRMNCLIRFFDLRIADWLRTMILHVHGRSGSFKLCRSSATPARYSEEEEMREHASTIFSKNA
jgi:hypothetical protein